MNRLIVLVGAALLAACSSTHIRVSDSAAQIYVDGEYIGTRDAYYRDRKPAFKKHDVALRKGGCVEQSHARRSERPEIGATIGAYHLTLPIRWLAQYKHHHEYDCLQAAVE
jgi:hypothetical protein